MRPSIRKNRESLQRSLVAFVVGSVKYALEIAHVREIVTPLPLTVLPHTPGGLAGVADHRDQVVPIIDVRARFGLPPSEGTNRKVKWVLVEIEGRTVGLVVDDVLGVLRVPVGDFRAPPDLGGGEQARAISSVTTWEKSLVFILDLSRFDAHSEAFSELAAHLDQGHPGSEEA
jgi:purine-binding chemotaxis protein CheW